nr:hypothetical protein [Tanacetum cinerariifolium]
MSILALFRKQSLTKLQSSVKNLLPILSEYEVTADDESMLVKDESFSVFTTSSNPLFDVNDDFTSSDDESIPEDDLPIEGFKVYSNTLFDETDCDTLIDSSLKFDFLEEFSGALMPTSVADEERIRREHAEYISLMERLFTINPCPRPTENANMIIETLPTSTIPLKDKGDINVLEELLVDDSIPILENESTDFDHQDDPSFPRPPPEPPDVEFDFEPNSGEVIAAVMNNIDELNEDECFDPGDEIDVFANDDDDDYFPFIFVIRIFLPYLIYPEVSLLILSAESEDTIFDP